MQSEHFVRLYNGVHGPGVNSGFHIEEADRRLVVYNSSNREHEAWSDDGKIRANEEGINGVISGRPDDNSDNSEDYEEEELDLESAKDMPLSQIASQDGSAAFHRMNSEPGAIQKFGMFSFLNYREPKLPARSHENGDRNESNGDAALPDSMFVNPTTVDKRVPQQQESSVRHFLSDPVSGILMDDALILPCGHSVGQAGFERVQETNACVVCMSPTTPVSAAPNHALRAAVQAFKRERECPNLTTSRPKRRREQEVKGVQFPYSVSDRVLIKGNKRTPERFVGREAIITTQCLNGWYLVRTIDNGESVRLQYRSLEKIGD